MTEISRKLGFLRKTLKARGLSAFRFRGVDWFSWITCGGSSVVILTNEVGVAEVLVTQDSVFVMTNRIEHGRMMDEEISPEVLAHVRVTDFPWQDSSAADRFVSELVGGRRMTVASDRPTGGEVGLPAEVVQHKTCLQLEEIIRYRHVGHLAAQAMTDAMLAAKPEWTEQKLASAGAEALVARGLEPTLVLVSGQARGLLYRHPLPKAQPIGGRAMMVFCARGFGLYANLTRFVSFGPLDQYVQRKFTQLSRIESAGFSLIKPGERLSQIYAGMAREYRELGLAEHINEHHQGGTTGYLSRERVASPELKGELDTVIEDGMAFAWNPSLPGAKVEDTVLLQNGRLEVLTVDPRWPVADVNGIKRPQVMIRS